MRAALGLQAAYYGLTGVWGLAHFESFERITGPKASPWLVRTVSVLVTAIGAALGIAAARERVLPETKILAAGSAAGLAAIDLPNGARGRISRVYIIDGVAQLAFCGAILVRSLRRS